MGVVDTVILLVLVFLLMIILGLQMQITAAGKELSDIKAQLKLITDRLNRSKSA